MQPGEENPTKIVLCFLRALANPFLVRLKSPTDSIERMFPSSAKATSVSICNVSACKNDSCGVVFTKQDEI